ncbi:MAG TPA: type II toxin-antitoxin system HicB family antitoxin [Bauldia sp.]|nr:type II toxin-antitoxin system HicB family antitoxin [Bauldia sp.]
MKTFAYPATFEPGDAPGVVVVTFPDLPEVITEGDGPEDARRMAADALGTALLAYARAGRRMPRASRAGKGRELVAVEPEVAAKLAVLLAFAESGLSQRELGRRLGKDEREVRRILDPMHPTKIGALDATLRALGRRLVVGVVRIADAA